MPHLCRILVISLAISWLRPFLNEDLCGLIATASALSCLLLAFLFPASCWLCSSRLLFALLFTCLRLVLILSVLPFFPRAARGTLIALNFSSPPRAARGTGPTLKVSASVTSHRAPDAARVVRPCLEKLSCGNQRANIVHVAKLKFLALRSCVVSDEHCCRAVKGF